MKKHVLLIEEDIQLSENISEILNIHNYLVTTCDDGRNAIDLIENKDGYDLIISDMLDQILQD
jgi:DNA-binding response OmpR family regulator